MVLTVLDRGGGVPPATAARQVLENGTASWFGDDYADGKLTSRDGLDATPTSLTRAPYHFRPEWTAALGTPSATASGVELASGDAVVASVFTPTHMDLTWEFDWQFATTPSSGIFRIEYMMEAHESESLSLVLDNSGPYHGLRKFTGGVESTIANNGWTRDTNPHTSTVSVSGDSWSVQLDAGTTQSATETYRPATPTIRLTNDTDATITISRYETY